MVNGLLLTSAALSALGVALASTLAVLDGTRSTGIVSSLKVAFAPRGWLGSGEAGDSPFYSIIWWVVLGSNVVSTIFLVVVAFTKNADDETALFIASILVASSLIVVSGWPIVFRQTTGDATWPLWAAAALTTVAGLLALSGLAVYMPGLKSDVRLMVFLSIPWSLLTGWLLTALSIGYAMAAGAETAGGFLNLRSTDADATGWAPMIVATVLAGLAAGLGEPAVCVPLLAATLFMKQDWKIWVAMGILGLGIVGGIVRITLQS